MPDELEQIRFTAHVLGPGAAYRLEKRQVTQTIRAGNSSITEAIINGRASAGDRLKIVLDGVLVGRALLISMDAVTWATLYLEDARRGGFDTLAHLEQALRRAGYRFKPLTDYPFFRIQFTWLEERDENRRN